MDNPYPTPDDAQVTYTVRELLERIEHKIDHFSNDAAARLHRLEMAEPSVRNGEARITDLEDRLHQAEKRIQRLNDEAVARGGVESSRKKQLVLVGAGSALVSTVAAIVALVINSL